jgi:hypothetical protein
VKEAYRFAIANPDVLRPSPLLRRLVAKITRLLHQDDPPDGSIEFDDHSFINHLRGHHA